MRSLCFSLCTPDQTPTPTRFLKNCEEVGLFNELASSFEQEFPKAQEDEDKRAKNLVSYGTGWRDSVIQSDVLQTWGARAACCQKLKIYGLQSSLSVLMCNTVSSCSLLLCLSCSSSVFLFFPCSCLLLIQEHLTWVCRRLQTLRWRRRTLWRWTLLRLPALTPSPACQTAAKSP